MYHTNNTDTHTHTHEQIRLKTLVRNAEREEKQAIKAREKTDHPNGFEATIEELEAQRDNVLGDDGEQERETKKLQKKIKKLEKELKSKQKKNGKLKEKQGRLQAKLEASQEMEDRLDSSIQDLASKYCVAVPSQQQGTQSQHDMMLKVAHTFKQRLDTMLSSKDAQLQERTCGVGGVRGVVPYPSLHHTLSLRGKISRFALEHIISSLLKHRYNTM